MNADRFGGDRNRITIAGQDPGSLVGYHLFIKESSNLFANMILQSGTPFAAHTSPISKYFNLANWYALISTVLLISKRLRNEANKRANSFLSYLDCDVAKKSNSEITLCLQKSETILNSAQLHIDNATDLNKLSQAFLITMFQPVIDGRLFKEAPIESLKRGNFKKCPLLTGFTTDEGTMFLAKTKFFGTTLVEIQEKPNLNISSLTKFLEDYFAYYPFYPQSNNKLFINAVIHEYTRRLDSHVDILEIENYFVKLSKIIGDQLVKCPTYDFIDLIAKYNANVYFYLFAHRISSTPWPSWYGATHGDDLGKF